MAVDLRVRRVPGQHAARRRVPVLRCDQGLGVLLTDLRADAADGPWATVSTRYLIASLTAAACASLISRRWAESPSAHTADTDFGALNVRSMPPPRAPVAPAARSHSSVRGCRPSMRR